jgi:NAD(P) transhydrogenase subunit alpha
MVIGVLKEQPPETRVAVIPEGVHLLKDHNINIMVEHEAGMLSNFSDKMYEEAGAVISGRKEILDTADVIPVVGSPGLQDVSMLREGLVIAGCLNPFADFEMVRLLAERHVTSFSMELLPRTTIAQSMDILSSMAMISGYKAVIEAAMMLPRFFPMFITAAGTIKPAKVLIIGAGVAGYRQLLPQGGLGL